MFLENSAHRIIGGFVQNNKVVASSAIKPIMSMLPKSRRQVLVDSYQLVPQNRRRKQNICAKLLAGMAEDWNWIL
jgi:hypothetical protein